MTPVDVAIIGAGPAGCAAAVQLVRLGATVALLDRTGRAGGLIRNAWRIENEPGTGGPISGPEYVRRLVLYLNDFKIPVRTCEVTGIICPETEPTAGDTTGSFRVSLSDSELESRAVILATGTAPRPAGLPGESELFRTGKLYYEVADVLPLEPPAVTIVGAGEAAFDYALSLTATGCRVTILARSANHRANARLARAVNGQSLITVGYQHTVTAIHQLDNLELTTQSPTGPGKHLTDLILVAIGRTTSRPPISPLPLSFPSAFPPPTSHLPYSPKLYIAGDSRLGSLGQLGIAVGDGLECAKQAWLDLQENKT
jgi:thioredoxin reductase (NADPH)